ncbi:MAG: hypothetical protein ABIP75_13310 [Pyrinomonadaceae bacterium]
MRTAYDGMGQRVATEVGGNWRYMVYDAGGKLIAEYGGAESSGTGGVKYMLSDHQGSVRAVLNENGWVAGRYDYQPFGEEVGAGVGMRTMEHGFSSDDTPRGARNNLKWTVSINISLRMELGAWLSMSLLVPPGMKCNPQPARLLLNATIYGEPWPRIQESQLTGMVDLNRVDPSTARR